MADEVTPVNQRVALADIAPHERNYNRHPADQVKRIAASLRKFGQVRSIVVWRSTILAGHGVVEAARSLGWKEITADVLPDTYPEHLALAYVAADNELARLGDPDQAALAAILQESAAADAELLEAIGYGEAELQALLEEVGKGTPAVQDAEAQVDRAEELRQQWGVEPGQLWQLGEHRLICGDCTDAATVARVMGGERAVLMATDPPYGVAYTVETGVGSKFGAIANDENDGERLQKFLESAFSAAKPVLFDNAAWYLWHAQMTQGFFAAAAAAAAVIIHRQIIWVKPSLILGHGDYHWRHELCFYGWVEGHRPPWYGDRKQTTVWEVGRENDGVHPTQKPVELFERPLRFNTRLGDIAYEPFLGSGTTLIACENLGRRCRAVEIAPGYVAVALERWAAHTGKTPVLLE